MNNEYILEVKNLNKTFTEELAEPLVVLKDIDLKVKKGDFISLMGESGSGKSTLLYQIGCLDNPTSGEIIINGKDVTKLKEEERSKFRCRTIGFVFQFYNLVPNLTVEENISLPLIMAGKKKKDFKQELDEVIDLIGLSSKKKYYPKQLSGGQQQRVSIARAIIIRPDLLLADEPTGNLDSISSIEVEKLFQKLNREKNITIIQVTHSSEIAKYSNSTIHLKDGVIINEDRPNRESENEDRPNSESEEVIPSET